MRSFPSAKKQCAHCLYMTAFNDVLTVSIASVVFPVIECCICPSGGFLQVIDPSKLPTGSSKGWDNLPLSTPLTSEEFNDMVGNLSSPGAAIYLDRRLTASASDQPVFSLVSFDLNAIPIELASITPGSSSPSSTTALALQLHPPSSAQASSSSVGALPPPPQTTTLQYREQVTQITTMIV